MGRRREAHIFTDASILMNGSVSMGQEEMKPIRIKPVTQDNTSRAVRGSLVTPPWRLIWLLAAPHRLAFFMAALMLVMSSVWWGIILVTRALGMALFWGVPVSAAHGLLMTMAFMPLFFAGFLFTAG